MYCNPEIKTIERWEWVMWGLENDTEYIGASSGTPWHPLPLLERRYIQRISGKQVHIPDDGELEILPRDCEPFHVWLRCLTCGKEILAEI